MVNFSLNNSAGFRLISVRSQIKSMPILAPLIKEGNMSGDDLVALGVTLFVLVVIGLICALGLTGLL